MVHWKPIFVAVWALTFWTEGSLFPAVGQERLVHVYGWGDYIDPQIIEEFTQETGIKITYDTYESDETMEKRLGASKTGFDVVIVSGYELERQIETGRYLKLNKSKLSNFKYLWPVIMAHLAVHDPGNQFAVNYMWFTAGIAYNVKIAEDIVTEKAEAASPAGASAVSPNTPLIDSWNILFKPGTLKKFGSCGVDVLDNPREMFPVALQYLRLDPGSIRQTDLKRASDLLSVLQPHVRRFESKEYMDALAKGDICLAVGYSGESLRARERAREAENGIEIDYAIPLEGAPILLDNLAILSDSPHIEEAYAFIDFLLRPEIAARNTNFTHLANGVQASQALIDKKISGNASIYPGAAVMQRLFTPANHDPATQKFVDREWARIKLGKLLRH